MKVLLLDPNNDTPNINYPLVSTIQETGEIDIQLISSFNRFHSKYYDANRYCEPKYLFFQYENRISNKKLRKMLKIIGYPFYNFLLLYHVSRNSPDIIHYDWIKIPVIDYIFIRMYKFLGIKIILTQHNYYQHNKKRLRLLEFKIFCTVERIICLSNFVRDQFEKEVRQKVVLIKHGNCYEQDIRIYKKQITKDNQGSKFRILFLGTIKKYKGVELLLDSIGILINERYQEDIHVAITGVCSKNYSRRIKFLINEKGLHKFVNFQPVFLSNRNLYNLVYNTDIGVLPYLEATQSGIPYIYYSFYKPIVVTDVGALPEQVSEKIARVSKPNAIDFADSIMELKELIENKQIKESYFDDYLKQFKWTGITKEYIDLYKKLQG